jgi:hypothetical protein
MKASDTHIRCEMNTEITPYRRSGLPGPNASEVRRIVFVR